MGSLSDQLLKAGLTNKSKAQKVKTEKRRQKKQLPKGQAVADQELQAQVNQAETERRKRDQELNRQQKEVLREKENQARIKQIIGQHHLTNIDGDLEFNFVVDGKVKKFHVNRDVRTGLVRGSLSICTGSSGYLVIPTPIALKLQELENGLVISLDNSAEDETPDAEDPYADYQVPDDLVW